MSHRKLLTALVTTAAVVLGYSSNSLAATNTGSATANIVTPLAIAPNGTNSLNFGSISPNGSAGSDSTVTVSTSGNRSGVGLAGGSPDFGGFNVTGCNNCAYTVTMPTLPFSLDGAALQITAWSTATGSGGTSAAIDGAVNGTLSGTGSDTLSVGATLTVPAAQASGSYTKSYTVTVNYN